MQYENNERKVKSVYLSIVDVDVYIWHVSISIADLYRQKKVNNLVEKIVVDTTKPSDCNLARSSDGLLDS